MKAYEEKHFCFFGITRTDELFTIRKMCILKVNIVSFEAMLTLRTMKLSKYSINLYGNNQLMETVL